MAQAALERRGSALLPPARQSAGDWLRVGTGLMLLVLVLGGCAETGPNRPAESVPISPKLALVLPRPSDLGMAIEVTQLVTARYRAESYVFEGHISATPERFFMVGLDSLGRKAMTITWTDDSLSYDTAPWLPQQLQPENILADMVLMYWPETVVRRALGAVGGLEASPRQRSVLHDGAEIIRIEYAAADQPSRWPNLHYRHLVWNYELDIQSVESVR